MKKGLNTSTYSNEQDIIIGMNLKDEMVLEALFKNYSSKMYGIIAAVFDSNEPRVAVLEKAIHKSWFESEQYDPKKERFLTWMLKNVRTVIREEYQSAQINPKPIYDRGDLMNVIDKRDYPIFFMAFFLGAKMKDIANEFSITVPEAHKSLYRAFKSLRQHFNLLID